MLSKEQNDTLSRVGPGTPAGELLRMYWHPVAGSSELNDNPIKKIKLLDEDLVLYKDKSGQLGLVDHKCAHRGVSLEYGIIECNGIRCPYHGWQYDHNGQCLDQPNEPEESTFKNRIKIKSYPVQELGGLIFAYLGAEPAPLLPNYDLFVQKGVIKTIGYAVVPCNWLQIMENSMDPVHVEWLHGEYMKQVFERDGDDSEWLLNKHHVKIGFDRFEYGLIKRRVLEGQTEDDEDWKIGHPVVFPNILKVGGAALSMFQIRVPMDDYNTYHVWYTIYDPGSKNEIPADYPITLYEVPVYQKNGKFVDDHIDGQDIMAWVTQGGIADRTEEKLGSTDKGIIMYRQMLMEEIQKMKNNQDPICVFRDEKSNQYIKLPQEKDKFKAGYGGSKSFNSVLKRWNNRYAPNIDEIIEILDKG